MRIPDAKLLLSNVFAYNLDQMERGNGHKTFLVPYFESQPGVGKTAMIAQVAEELDVPHWLTIIAQYDAGELAGFGLPTDIEFEDDEGNTSIEKRVIRARPDYMPDPKTGGVVGFWNLDELPQAFLANQNICSQLVNAWRIGEHEVSPGITIVATGNAAEHKSGTTTMPMHLRDRLMHITLEAHHDDWLPYAASRKLHRWVRAAIGKNPSWLQKFEVGVKAFPSCRSWEKVSAVLSLNLPSHVQREALWGQIGEGMTTAFEAFIKVEDDMPDPRAILADPDNAPVFDDSKADILYLLVSNLVEIATEKNLDSMIRYIKRWPNQEFAAMWNRDIGLQHPKLNETKAMVDYKLTHMTKVIV